MGTTDIVEEKLCEICGEPLTARPCVICQRCHTLHHLDCWHYNEGCSVYGCRSRCCEAPENVRENDEIAIPEAINFGMSTWIMALGFYFLFFGLLLAITGKLGAALAISFVTCFWVVVILGLLRRFVVTSYLIFNNKKLQVERQWKLFNWDLTQPKLVPELVPENVREVHFLRYTTLGHSVEQLFYVDELDERQPLYMRLQAAPWQRLDPDKLECAADCLGNIVDAPVRTFHSISSQGKWSYLARALNILGMKPKEEPQLLPAGSRNEETKVVPGKKKGIIQAPTCPSCQGILTVPVIECALCKVIVHEHCWEEARGCPLAGCESRRGEKPAKPPSKLDDFTLVEARGPYEVFNLKYIVLPMILLTFTLSLGAVSKILLGISGTLLFIYLIVITLVFWYHMMVRREYRFSPRDGTIMLIYKCLGVAVNSSVLKDARADNIVEVFYESHPGMLMRVDELSIALRDGSRHVVYRSIPPTTIVDIFSSPTLSSEKVGEMAERLAAFGNCTVRMIRDEEELPSKEEIRRLGEAKGMVS